MFLSLLCVFFGVILAVMANVSSGCHYHDYYDYYCWLNSFYAGLYCPIFSIVAAAFAIKIGNSNATAKTTRLHIGFGVVGSIFMALLVFFESLDSINSYYSYNSFHILSIVTAVIAGVNFIILVISSSYCCCLSNGSTEPQVQQVIYVMHSAPPNFQLPQLPGTSALAPQASVIPFNHQATNVLSYNQQVTTSPLPPGYDNAGMVYQAQPPVYTGTQEKPTSL